MTSTANEPSTTLAQSKTMHRVGYALSALPVLFLMMDIAMKLLALPIVLTTSAQLGYPDTPAMAHTLGVILLACTVLYIYPRTAVLGAVLLTAFLGGTVATHVRVGSPLFTHTLFACGAAYGCATLDCARCFHGVAKHRLLLTQSLKGVSL